MGKIKTKEQKSKLTISIILIISLVLNAVLIFTLDDLDREWERDYTKSTIEWCEITNEQSDIINDLLLILKGHDESFKEMDEMGKVDCWS